MLKGKKIEVSVLSGGSAPRDEYRGTVTNDAESASVIVLSGAERCNSSVDKGAWGKVKGEVFIPWTLISHPIET
jgi:hypothetical protein